MTDSEIDKTPEQIAAIERMHEEVSDVILNIPAVMKTSRNLLTAYGVHSDENGKIEVPTGTKDVAFMSAIIELEARIAAIEEALGTMGLRFGK